MRTDNTKADEMAALVRRIEKLERQAPAGFTSITRGALRVASPEGLIVEGSEKVTGTLTISGTLNGDGTITWTGAMTNTGPVNLDGDTTISGKLDVSGLVSLLSDLLVKAGAQLVVEGSIPMQVGASVLGIPGVSFAGGGGLVGNGSGAAMFGGTGVGSGAAVVATASTASMSAGTKVISVDSTRAKIDGGLQLPNMPTKSGVTPNVYIDPVTFVVYRVV